MNNGLLERAQQVRVMNGIDEPGRQSGISVEDQKDILIQIDKVAQANRIPSGPELFYFTPARRGFFFPLIVNIAAIIVLAGGLTGFSIFFKREEAQITTDRPLIETAEGKLIQEIKKESEEKLKEKDREISDIQARLESIDKERNDLIKYGFRDKTERN